MSLVEIKARSFAAAKDTEVMTADMERQTKKDILTLSSNFKSHGLQMESIKTTQCAIPGCEPRLSEPCAQAREEGSVPEQ